MCLVVFLAIKTSYVMPIGMGYGDGNLVADFIAMKMIDTLIAVLLRGGSFRVLKKQY